MTINTCHICLEEIEYIETDLLKVCCPAFICNDCWNEIQLNNLINYCPICNSELLPNSIILEEDNISIKKKIYLFIINIIKLTILGNILINIVLFLIYHNLGNYIKEITELNYNPFFWCISYFLGIFIKYLYDKS